jgi:exopolysaccharide production protein ExoQ
MNTAAITFEATRADARPMLPLPYLIGFYFSFRLFIVLLTVRVLHSDAQTGAAINLCLNFLLFGLVAFHSFGPAPRTVRSFFRTPSGTWILIFLAFTGCSLAWSIAASLSAAFAFWCAMAADLGMVVLLLRTGPVVEAATSLMKGYVLASCCIALVAWMLPPLADLRLGDEELLGTNQIGYLCAFAIFLAQYLILVRQERGFWKFSLLFLGVTLLRSISKTSIIAFVAGQIVLLTADKSMSRKTKVGILLIVAVVLLLTSNLLASYYDDYINGGNDIESLTGRTGIWTYLYTEAIEKPWIGHGFHSVWKVIPPFYSDLFEARHAHNELLQQFYAYGAAGIIMLIGLYSSFYREVRKLSRSPLKALLLGLLVFVIIRGLADTEPFDLSLPLWAIAIFSALMVQTLTDAPAPEPLPPTP